MTVWEPGALQGGWWGLKWYSSSGKQSGNSKSETKLADDSAVSLQVFSLEKRKKYFYTENMYTNVRSSPLRSIKGWSNPSARQLMSTHNVGKPHHV